MSIKDHLSWALLQQTLSCVLMHMGYMEPRKLSTLDGHRGER
jgi:hypothetical protein